MIPHDGDSDNGGIIDCQWCATAMLSGEFQNDGRDVYPFISENGYTDADGLKYDVYTFVRNEPLKAGAMTEWNVWNYVGIAKTVNSADIEKAVENGVIKDGKLNVLVEADAIQAEGFADATAAFAAFDAQK